MHAIDADEQTAAPSGATGRLPYRQVLQEFAAMLGAQLAREHLAEARKASDTIHDQSD